MFVYLLIFDYFPGCNFSGFYGKLNWAKTLFWFKELNATSFCWVVSFTPSINVLRAVANWNSPFMLFHLNLIEIISYDSYLIIQDNTYASGRVEDTNIISLLN